MTTTYICDFPLDFPFFFTPERETAAVRILTDARELPPVRETPIP